MKMVAEYLEHAIHFEQMAAETADEELKETLLAQARALSQDGSRARTAFQCQTAAKIQNFKVT
jgi:hypothetical protein